MNRPKLKYQQLFTTLLLCAYLVGNLSIPIFEGIHFLLHLGHEVPLHSFQTHSTQHNHQVLATLDELVSNNSIPDVPINQSTDNKYKKIVQQLTNSPILSFATLIATTANFSTELIPHKTPFRPLYAPPPEV